MKERIAKMIDVKSIVTLVLTGIFAHLSIVGFITPENYMTIFTVVIAFYFGTQSRKATEK